MTATVPSAELSRISEVRHHDPFSVLGRHPDPAGVVLRAHLPQVTEVRIADNGAAMTRLPGTDIFEWRGDGSGLPMHYSLIWRDDANREHIARDPYTFLPQVGDLDLHLFGEGRHRHAYRVLGSHEHEVDGVAGVLFAVWAPNAERVSVVGDFNRWDGRRHPMRVRGGSGVWELFIPDLDVGRVYKYEIRSRESGAILLKADPYAQRHELRPRTASIVEPASAFAWSDAEWLEKRAQADWQHRPMSVYEVHLGSWQRDVEGEFLNYRELAVRLVEYVKETGFSHIELLPITEHPFDLLSRARMRVTSPG